MHSFLLKVLMFLIIYIPASTFDRTAVFFGIFSSKHLTSEFKKINIFQKVPVIDHDGFVLTESIAIIRYLTRHFDIEDHWYPKDSKLQAKVDEYLEWQHLNTRLFGSMIFRERVILPQVEKKPVNNEKLQFYKDNFLKVLKNIEEGFLKDKTYLCGDKISVSDIFCACEIEQPLAIGFDPFSDVPKLKSWFEKVRKELEPSYSEVNDALMLTKGGIEKGKL
ncbi:glutathione S-transferase theta-1-like [Stegodyphus dumicola]|uniref:glutathione S-transferase theta-1-like n=1 Tax=Stegodyphus dumicola TaxID=202533 RepID=UPI0015AB8E87|nr:glutathione S-transferase theta-1-like [Stegodyphus dumicola]